MAVAPVESKRYPYLPVELHVGDQILRVDALVDTGLDSDIVVPEGTPFDQPADTARSWGFADRSRERAPIRYGTARLGGFDAVPVDIAELGDETIMRRGIVDRYRVIFERGERVIVEP